MARILPVFTIEPYNEITSHMGPRKHPVTGAWQANHTGDDLRAPSGTPLLAVVDGEVQRIDRDGIGKGLLNGNAVFLRGDDGYLYCYCHMSSVFPMVGERVIQGQCIGNSGATGRVTAAHLHWSVYGPDKQLVKPSSLYPTDRFRDAK